MGGRLVGKRIESSAIFIALGEMSQELCRRIESRCREQFHVLGRKTR